MSYSFSVRAATKLLAIAAVAAALDKVAADQPIHQQDKAQAQAAAESFINVLPDAEDKDVCVSMSGSCSATWDGQAWDSTKLSSANVMVTASLATREEAKPAA